MSQRARQMKAKRGKRSSKVMGSDMRQEETWQEVINLGLSLSQANQEIANALGLTVAGSAETPETVNQFRDKVYTIANSVSETSEQL